jgi:hypothetical protein
MRVVDRVLAAWRMRFTLAITWQLYFSRCKIAALLEQFHNSYSKQVGFIAASATLN